MDVDAVAAQDERLGALLWAYHQRCRALWRALRAGKPAGQYVAVRRVLAEHVQRNTKTAKVDLVGQLAALEELEGFSQLVAALTEAEPDLAVLQAMAAAWGGSVSAEPGVVTVTVPVEGAYAFSDALGGLAGFGEVRRILTITARQAAWRDRRVRRLARVLVEAEEIWAAPADVGAAVTALPAAA